MFGQVVGRAGYLQGRIAIELKDSKVDIVAAKRLL
jgi:hypothetical protein